MNIESSYSRLTMIIFIEANEVLLLNGFMKKSTKDYKAHIKIAEKIINELAK